MQNLQCSLIFTFFYKWSFWRSLDDLHFRSTKSRSLQNLSSIVVRHSIQFHSLVWFYLFWEILWILYHFCSSTLDREQKVTRWLKLLIEKSSTFQAEGSPSYGETLLLIAIHFHSHSLEPIIDLVSSTLGIKLRPASLTKLKILFTQTIFPEKVCCFFY